MALVTTISEVIGVLAAMAVLLWFSFYIESRQLGPAAGPVGERSPAGSMAPEAAETPLSVVVEAVSPAA